MHDNEFWVKQWGHAFALIAFLIFSLLLYNCMQLQYEQTLVEKGYIYVLSRDPGGSQYYTWMKQKCPHCGNEILKPLTAEVATCVPKL